MNNVIKNVFMKIRFSQRAVVNETAVYTDPVEDLEKLLLSTLKLDTITVSNGDPLTPENTIMINGKFTTDPLSVHGGVCEFLFELSSPVEINFEIKAISLLMLDMPDTLKVVDIYDVVFNYKENKLITQQLYPTGYAGYDQYMPGNRPVCFAEETGDIQVMTLAHTFIRTGTYNAVVNAMLSMDFYDPTFEWSKHTPTYACVTTLKRWLVMDIGEGDIPGLINPISHEGDKTTVSGVLTPRGNEYSQRTAYDKILAALISGNTKGETEISVELVFSSTKGVPIDLSKIAVEGAELTFITGGGNRFTVKPRSVKAQYSEEIAIVRKENK